MLINGIESNNINAMDRGLAYGDGLFSTMKVENGQVQLWDFHLQRLQLGAQKLFFPEIDWAQLSAEVQSVSQKLTGERLSIIKIILTRGSGGRGYSSQGCNAPQRIISTAIFPHFYKQWQEQGIKLIMCDSQLSSNTQLAGLKTLNRLEQVLIKNELEHKQAVEGIVCDSQGYVIEACTANLFICFDNQWKTPKLTSSGVAGVKRRQLMMLASKAGIEITEENIHRNQLENAQAICLTNALMDIVPVNQFQQIIYDQSSLLRCKQLQSLIQEGNR